MFNLYMVDKVDFKWVENHTYADESLNGVVLGIIQCNEGFISESFQHLEAHRWVFM